MLEIGIDNYLEEMRAESAEDPYHAIIRSIRFNPFQTEFTQLKRVELSMMYGSAKAELLHLGAREVVCFPIGSIASGTALKKSDMDGAIVYESPIFIDEQTFPFQLPPHVWIASSEAHTSMNEIMSIAKQYPNETHRIIPYKIAQVFYPSLREHVDAHEQSIVWSWRKRILESLYESCNLNRAQQIWNQTRVYLKEHLIYAQQTWDVDGYVKEERVQMALGMKVQQLYPNDAQKQHQTIHEVNEARKRTEFPNFQTMLHIFEIEK
jgi:hypothetical protein